jgi:hypothetical protein
VVAFSSRPTGDHSHHSRYTASTPPNRWDVRGQLWFGYRVSGTAIASRGPLSSACLVTSAQHRGQSALSIYKWLTVIICSRHSEQEGTGSIVTMPSRVCQRRQTGLRSVNETAPPSRTTTLPRAET